MKFLNFLNEDYIKSIGLDDVLKLIKANCKSYNFEEIKSKIDKS